MRRPLTFDCGGATLAGVLHPAAGETGVVIVAGGVQTRVGSHRGFVDLADRLAAAGYPVLRFDRRGVGDSDGDDPGYRGSAPDIAAAIATLRATLPDLRRVVGWGLCDGAAALALGDFDLDALILANPWTRDAEAAATPARAAVAARYRQRLAAPDQWRRLLSGGVDLRKLAAGMAQMLKAEPVPALAQQMAAGLARAARPALVVLAGRDATAQEFAALWRGSAFKQLRARRDVTVIDVAGATHTFADREDAQAMAAACLDWLARLDATPG